MLNALLESFTLLADYMNLFFEQTSIPAFQR